MMKQSGPDLSWLGVRFPVGIEQSLLRFVAPVAREFDFQ